MKTKGKTKKKEDDEEEKDDEKPKKKPAKKSTLAVKKKKKATDALTKLCSDYSESPHLQSIEDSYLKYLEASYAKQSHLKEVKKFQILHALKTIQRFWKIKFQ